jgi:hypothetical protein
MFNAQSALLVTRAMSERPAHAARDAQTSSRAAETDSKPPSHGASRIPST